MVLLTIDEIFGLVLPNRFELQFPWTFLFLYNLRFPTPTVDIGNVNKHLSFPYKNGLCDTQNQLFIKQIVIRK